MNWNYEGWLATRLNSLILELGLSIRAKVFSEREFLRSAELEPGEVGVVTRRSQSEITFGAEVAPVQILILSEANSIEESTSLFAALADRYNYATDPSSGSVRVKHQYSSPVTMTNFDSVSYGYRSVMYVNATLVVVEGVSDVTGITYHYDGGNEELDAIDFTVSYTMQTNSQNSPVGQLVTSVKTNASLAITFTVPMLDSEFVSAVVGIMRGDGDGNATFEISFYVGDVEVAQEFKLINAQITTARDQVPALQIGMVV